jgi:hypothetical protein
MIYGTFNNIVDDWFIVSRELPSTVSAGLSDGQLNFYRVFYTVKEISALPHMTNMQCGNGWRAARNLFFDVELLEFATRPYLLC